MRSLRCLLLAAIPFTLLSAGCSGGSTGTDGGLDAPATDVPTTDAPVADVATTDVPPPPAPRCRTGAAWTTAMPAFRNDTTAAWGLAAARGSNLASGDIDGDGYPDLVVLGQTYNQRTNLDSTPPKLFTQVYMNRPRPDGTGRMFVDATRSSNFLATRAGDAYGRVTNIVSFGDVDNDGDLDAYTLVYLATGTSAAPDTGDRATVMLNDGTGVFSVAPVSAAAPDDFEGVPEAAALAMTDQDRDGNIDLFVGYWYDTFGGVEVGQQHELFHGVGDGTFTRVTDQVGLTLSNTMASFATAGQRRPLYGASACDVTGDGRQDLIGAAYGRQWNLLYVNEGDHYRDESLPSGVAGDMNLDYSDDQSYRCFCQANPSMCPSTIPAPAIGYPCPGRGWQAGYNDQPWRLNGNTFTIACGDVDNDGDMDLFTSEIHHSDVGSASDVSELLVNMSTGDNAMFVRPGRAVTGIDPHLPAGDDEGGLSAGFLDFDGDGRLDVYLGLSDYPDQFSTLFHQNADGTFTEVGAAAGFHHACPHGLALADFDQDGDEDIIVGSSLARDCATIWRNGPELRVYENIAGDPNWTSVRLVGGGAGKANRSAIGATVRVTSGGVTQTREVHGTYGHFGLNEDLVLHFGLGNNCQIDRMEVRWPDAMGTVETFTNVVSNYRLEIRQGEGFVRYQP